MKRVNSKNYYIGVTTDKVKKLKNSKQLSKILSQHKKNNEGEMS